jgi:uncharacterized protein (TIGR03067 family)
MVRAQYDGESAPDLVTQRTEVELSGGRYTVFFDHQITDQGTFEVADEASSRVLVLRGESGPNAGRTIPCIYQLVGERLRICYGLAGVAPDDFTTAPDQQRYLAIYRRL